MQAVMCLSLGNVYLLRDALFSLASCMRECALPLNQVARLASPPSRRLCVVPQVHTTARSMLFERPVPTVANNPHPPRKPVTHMIPVPVIGEPKQDTLYHRAYICIFSPSLVMASLFAFSLLVTPTSLPSCLVT